MVIFIQHQESNEKVLVQSIISHLYIHHYHVITTFLLLHNIIIIIIIKNDSDTNH